MSMLNDVSTDRIKPTSRVCVSKEDAAKMKVGSSVSLSMSGTVKSLHPAMDDKAMYEAEIEDSSVEVKQESSKDDENMATMPRKKLKEKIQPSSDEE